MELWIDLDGTNFDWDDNLSRPVNAHGQVEDFPWTCVDDNSIPGETRCTSLADYDDYTNYKAQ